MRIISKVNQFSINNCILHKETGEEQEEYPFSLQKQRKVVIGWKLPAAWDGEVRPGAPVKKRIGGMPRYGS